jgi:hypothetical protein
MAAIKFVLGENVLQFSKGIQYPVHKPVRKSQVRDRTGGGTWRREDLGLTIRRFPIVFKGLPLDDYNALMNWHEQVCNGMEHEFTYYDEDGVPHTVLLLTEEIDFPQKSYQRYSGELLLEVVG